MDQEQANALFRQADNQFREHQYEQALETLEILEGDFGDNHRLLNAKARTLAQLGRFEESMRYCDRLLDEFHYIKIRPFRERLREQIAQLKNDDAQPGEYVPVERPAGVLGTAPAPETAPDTHDWSSEWNAAGLNATESQQPSEPRFKIKPVRLILLALIIFAAVQGYLHWGVAAALVAAYFLANLLLSRLLVRLFSIPFKMKGKALAGATVRIHEVTPTDAPKDSGEEADDEEEDEGQEMHKLRFFWVDLTISPQDRSQGFTHYDPGELAVAPLSRKIRSLEDLDHCYSVRAVKVVRDGEVVADDGSKYRGAHRFHLLFGVPENEQDFKFVYYTEVFGQVSL